MALPLITNPRTTVTLPDGTSLDVRGLTRGEAFELQGLGVADSPRDMEVHLIACGTDTPVDEARQWHSNAPSSVIDPIIDAVSRLSGFAEDDDGRPTETQ